MKEPIYKGPKKHHAAVFTNINVNTGHVGNKIRVLHSDGSANYMYYVPSREEYYHNLTPCWFSSEKSWRGNYEALMLFDAPFYETIFLGYVRDTELEYV